MTEFKTGDRIRAVRDTTSKYGTPIPKDATGTVVESPYADLAFRPDDRTLGVRRHVPPEDFEHVNHGTGDGSASDICAEPGCNCDLERRFPAPLDPAKVAITIKGGDYIEAESDGTKIGGKVSHVTERGFVSIEHLGEFAIHHITPSPLPEGYRMFVLTAHQPAPEPEPEWKPGTVADIEVGGDMQYRAIRTDDHLWSTESHWSYEDAEVTDVRPLVVIDPAEAWHNLDVHLAGTGDLTQAEADLLGNVFPEVDLGLA